MYNNRFKQFYSRCVLKTGLLLFLFMPLANAQSGIDKFDMKVLDQIAQTRTEGRTHLFQTISDANNYVNLAVPVGLFVAGVIDDNKHMRQNALYVISSTATTALLNVALKHLFKRQRPYKAHISFVPVSTASGYSFPSGHTSASFSTATALSRAYPKWYVIAPSLIWAGTVGYSRLYLGVHHPSDVAAGALLGAGTAFGMGFIRP